jgi:hypothetical protein
MKIEVAITEEPSPLPSDFAPGMTQDFHAVVFTSDQAGEALAYLPLGRLCLCVDVPRCLWVDNLRDAHRFYTEKDAA